VASPDQRALQNAASALVSALLAKGSKCLTHPKSLGGAVTGLAYLWASNLVLRSPELKSFMGVLLKQVTPTYGSHWPYNPRVILPSLKLMLESGMVTAKDLWLPAQEIDRRIGELGAIVDTIDVLPPLPLPAAPVNPSAPGGKLARQRPPEPPGLTRVLETPKLGVFAPSSSTSTPAARSGDRVSADRAPKKTFKSRQAPADIVHTTPVLIGKGTKKKQEADKPPITTAGDSHPDKRAQASKNQKTNPPKQKSLPVQPAKSKRRPDSRPALDPVQRALCTAIVCGDVKQVAAQLNSCGEWTKNRIIAVLDQLQDELLMVGKSEISALELFLTTIQRLLPQDGAKILTTYYAEHMPGSGGVLSLLEKHDLSFDFQGLESPAKLMEFVSTASDKKLHAFMESERGRELVCREDADGRHLMTAAILGNHMMVLDKLLRTPLGLWMTTQPDHKGNSPLLVALGFEKIEAAAKLLKLSSANDQAMMVTTDGLNPLIIAIKIRALPIIRMLLALPSQNQQAIRQTKLTGYNALMQAAVSDQIEVIEMLLQLASADEQLLATTKAGQSVLGLAIERNRTGVVDKLLAHASAPGQIAMTKLGDLCSVMTYALLYEKRWIAELLLSSPTADDQVRIALRHGHNPLLLALEHELLDIATRLLALKSANDQALLINNPQSFSPLMIAAHRGYLTVVHLLLGLPSADAQSLAASKQGWIPLTAASQGGYIDIVRELLRLPTAEKQIHVAAIDGYTALDHAVVEGHLEIVELLKQAEAPAKQSTT
jgi:ankyrin repeat protein